MFSPLSFGRGLSIHGCLTNVITVLRSREALAVSLCATSYVNRRMNSANSYKFETLAVSKPLEHVLNVQLNRPEKRNAMNQSFWREMVECFQQIANDSECRAVVLSGAGKIFTAGLDLMDMGSFIMDAGKEPSRRAHDLKKLIKSLQKSFAVIEDCPQPIIAAIQAGCVGGGVDMVCACDIRVCSADAWFQVKEVDLGLAADMGTLQRLPKIVGNDSLARELCYTARRFTAQEAKEFGFVSNIYPDVESLMKGALDLAGQIAKKSPVAIAGTKHNLNYARDHSVKEGLDYMGTWNMSMLQTEDILKSVQAGMNKEEAVFSKL